jgi:lipopolysaccharide export system protein LptA
MQNREETVKRLSLIGLLVGALTLTVQAIPQATTTPAPQQSITATRITMDGLVTHFIGKVAVKSDEFVMEADEADFHSDTGEIEARGHVTIRIVSTSNGSPATISADRITYRYSQSKP